MTLSAVKDDKFRVGNDAGWALAFHREDDKGKISSDDVLVISSSDYHAEIQATLPGGLEGGAYQFIVERITDSDYAQIVQNVKKDKKRTVVRLYLYWRDLGEGFWGGYAAGLAGLADVLNPTSQAVNNEWLVAELSIKRVSRRAGKRGYEAVIEAQERVYHQLDNQRLRAPLAPDPPMWAALQIAEKYDLSLIDESTLDSDPPKEGQSKNDLEAGQTLLAVMKSLGEQMEAEAKLYGRGMFLIRNGKLIMGDRFIPHDGDIKTLDHTNGLIQIEPLDVIITDPNFDYLKNEEEEPPRETRYRLILKGRPDLKPGDVVCFGLPELEDGKLTPAWTGLLGELAGELAGGSLFGKDLASNDTLLYVAGVDHKLRRETSFVTTVTGISVGGTNNLAWDVHTTTHKPESGQDGGGDDSGEGRTARAVSRLVRRAVDQNRFPEVGEVREMTNQAMDVRPTQTLAVWQGLAAPDGQTNQAHRLEIQRPPAFTGAGIPYLTPFAWGKCGLVLPFYFGSRVLVDYRNGQRSDPVVLGTLHEADKGRDSEAGDWWLSLPAEARDDWAAPDEEATPADYAGKVTHDLIDAEGNRVIEVGELTVRIGRDNLSSAGDRPFRADEADSVTIEHADAGSSIVMKPNGDIVIRGANIELDAGSGNITLTANRVDVRVEDRMDVS